MFSNSKLGIVMVVVSDMDASVKFYRDVLGIPCQYTSPDWSQLSIGGVGLGLHIQGEGLPVNSASGISFGFYVKDIEPVLATLAERGVTPVRVTQEDFGTLAIIPDPDGYGIQICQSKYNAGD